MMGTQFGTLANLADKLREDDAHDKEEQAKRIRRQFGCPRDTEELHEMLRLEARKTTDEPEKLELLYQAIEAITLDDWKQAVTNQVEHIMKERNANANPTGIRR